MLHRLLRRRVDEALDVLGLIILESTMQESGVADLAEVPLRIRFDRRPVEPRNVFQFCILPESERVRGVASVPTDLASLQLALQRGI